MGAGNRLELLLQYSHYGRNMRQHLRFSFRVVLAVLWLAPRSLEAVPQFFSGRIRSIPQYLLRLRSQRLWRPIGGRKNGRARLQKTSYLTEIGLNLVGSRAAFPTKHLDIKSGRGA